MDSGKTSETLIEGCQELNQGSDYDMIHGINDINSVDNIYHYHLGMPVLSLTITPSSLLVGPTTSRR